MPHVLKTSLRNPAVQHYTTLLEMNSLFHPSGLQTIKEKQTFEQLNCGGIVSRVALNSGCSLVPQEACVGPFLGIVLHCMCAEESDLHTYVSVPTFSSDVAFLCRRDSHLVDCQGPVTQHVITHLYLTSHTLL